MSRSLQSSKHYILGKRQHSTHKFVYLYFMLVLLPTFSGWADNSAKSTTSQESRALPQFARPSKQTQQFTISHAYNSQFIEDSATEFIFNDNDPIIAFIVNNNGVGYDDSPGIYLMNLATGVSYPLVISSIEGFTYIENLVWSPDGHRLAFDASSVDNIDLHQIYVVSIPDGHIQKMTNDQRNNYLSAWSPDGSQILFVSRGEQDSAIHVMNNDGSGVRNISNNTGTDFMAMDFSPVWSPSGEYIAFISRRTGNTELFVLNLLTDEVQQITSFGAPNLIVFLSWSPASDQLAFGMHSGDYDIYTIDQDGSDLTQMTTNYTGDGNPFWSPDGTSLAFVSWSDSNNIFIVNADLSLSTQVTELYGENDVVSILDWSNSGILYRACAQRSTELCELFVLNPENGLVIRITSINMAEDAAVWRP